MDENVGKKILIVGNGAKAYTFAQKMSALEEVEEVFTAPGNDAAKEFSTVVDIREENVQELLEFVLENGIDLTVVTSENAIKQDIATLFQQNGQMIFAPSFQSANICLSKSFCKKFMYKNHIPCPKFGIFDKPSAAIEYVNKSPLPVVIKTDEHQGENGVLVCNSYSVAQSFIEDLFAQDEKKVIIEDFVLGHEFSFYVITDGYRALPLGSVANYKYALDGNGGLITTGQGAFSPDYKLSKQVEKRILQQIIYPTLNNLARNQTPYVGILGLDGIINSQEQIYSLEFNSSLQVPDCQSILALLEENLYKLFEACAIGSFADDYENIAIEDKYAASCILSVSKKEGQFKGVKNQVEKIQGSIITGLDEISDETDIAHINTKKNQYLEYETTGGRTLVVTTKAKTLARAVEELYDEIDLIKFEGKKFRKDIGKFLKEFD